MAKSVKRPSPLSIRLNEVERAALMRRAGGVGLSTYAKSVLFADGQMPRPRRSSADRALLAQVLGQLGASGLGARVAALAEAAESGSLLLDAETTSRLRGASEDIGEMRRMLMAALGWQLPARETASVRQEFREAAE